MSEKLYPKNSRRRKKEVRTKPKGRYLVRYDMLTDGGFREEFTRTYRTLRGARISAWWYYHIRYYSGIVKLYEIGKGETNG